MSALLSKSMTLNGVTVRVSFNLKHHKWTIYTQRGDANGWRSVAKRTEVLLKDPQPHFYRGTQKKWLSGQLRRRTPFWFLEGEMIEPINLDGLRYGGKLFFDSYKDYNFRWVTEEGDSFEISPEEGSELPEGILIYCIGGYYPSYLVYSS